MATHSSIFAWRIPWKRRLVGYSPWGHNRLKKESDTTELLSKYARTHARCPLDTLADRYKVGAGV